ncbi:MAG TPA: hypothetical protein PK003_04825 [Bacillota bacterium]|nr:hypothetical protein [Bacillota bacterium]
MLSDITGDSICLDVARGVVNSWIDKVLIRRQDGVMDWNWDYGGKVGKLNWTAEEFDKIQGAFVSGSWATRDGHEWVCSVRRLRSAPALPSLLTLF